MAERAPKLEWSCDGKPNIPQWKAKAGPLPLQVVELATGEFVWTVVGVSEDREDERDCWTCPSLVAAQLAAEDAALTWLREGVEALGGKVTSPEQFDGLLRAFGLLAERLKLWSDAEVAQLGEAFDAIARELEGKP